jgi:ferric-dicitrate binding protein FerR (iron transport regulator)
MKKYDKDFLHRYLTGVCSEQEKRDFWLWLAKADSMEVTDQMRQKWENCKRSDNGFLGARDRLLSKIHERMQQNDRLDHKPIAINDSHTTLTYTNTRNRLRYAAMIILALVSAAVFFYVANVQAPSPATTPTLITKSTKSGQRLTLRLPDGSMVFLNSNSKISFPENFAAHERTVSLAGEAFFDVTEDNEKPFSVLSGSLSTTALGTSFNVRYHTDSDIATVSLVDGMVQVSVTEDLDQALSVMLKPGEEVLYSKSVQALEKRLFEKDQLAWKDGVLQFNEDNIGDVVKKLEQWYGVQIEVVEPPDYQWKFIGKFENQSLENVLRGMSFSKDVEYKIEDDIVYLIFN